MSSLRFLLFILLTAHFITIQSQCNNNEFTCGSGECIDSYWRCDGEIDCGDNSDEIGCSESDTSHTSHTSTYDPMYPAWNANCTESQFTCSNGNCIYKYWQCDDWNDCGDNSDEINCSSQTTQANTCYSDEFKCVNGNCIPYYWKCDNYDDCGDNSDETKCGTLAEDCKDNEFQCNTGSCISQEWVCDFWDDCADGSDEASCSNGYICQFNSNKLTTASLMAESSTYNTPLTKKEAEEIIDAAENFEASGIDIQDNLALISLLFVNVITSIFIIFGLEIYEKKIGFKGIDISYITLLIVMTQHLLLSTINLFTKPVVTCTQGSNGYESISWFDVLQYALSTLLWLIWVKYSYKGTCNKYVTVIITVSVAFLVPFIIGIIPEFGVYISRYVGSGLLFITSQAMIPIIWIYLVMEDKITWKCKTKLCECCPCCQRGSTCIGNGIIMILLQIIGIVFFFLFWIINADSNEFNSCLIVGGSMWFNPMWLVINIILLFSAARNPVIMYNMIMIIISIIGAKHGFICVYVINLQYVLHAVLLPIYIIIMFFSMKELNKWTSDLITMYLVSFDVFTDVTVIYYFIQSHDYIFAILSTLFIISGQIFGSFSDDVSADKNDQRHFHLTKRDKILALFGFSGPWFMIKSWSNNDKYKKLYEKHQIWEIMFEAIPSVALQIYAALSQSEKSPVSLIVSILVSIVTISYSVWNYLVKLTNKNGQNTYNLVSTKVLEDNDDPITVKLAVGNDKKHDELPDEWRVVYTPEGKEYYQNDITQQTQCERPIVNMNEAVEIKNDEQKEDNDNSDNLDICGGASTNNGDAQTIDIEENSVEIITEEVKEELINDDDDDNDEKKAIKQEKETRMDKLKCLPLCIRNKLNFLMEFIRNKFGNVLEDKVLYSNLYAFMLSDFYIRTMSLIIFISSIPCPDDQIFCGPRIGTGITLIFGLLIFEFIMNKKIRIVQYQTYKFILTIFSISILSSFYTILSSLDLLKNDKFFGKSVHFKLFLFEHKVRIYLSIIMNLLNLILYTVNDDNRNGLILILIIIYFAASTINYFALNVIQKYVDPPNKYPFQLFKSSKINKTNLKKCMKSFKCQCV